MRGVTRGMNYTDTSGPRIIKQLTNTQSNLEGTQSNLVNRVNTLEGTQSNLEVTESKLVNI